MGYPDDCITMKHPQATHQLLFLHGYHANKWTQLPIAYNFYQKYKSVDVLVCDARGHGSRDKHGESKDDWIGTITDYATIIDRPTTIIGHSMGGAMAISLGLQHPEIRQVFAVAAPHGKSLFMNLTQQKRLRKIFKNNNLTEENAQALLTALPDKYVPDRTQQPCSRDDFEHSKFFLIHDKNDQVIPITEYQLNQQALCVPETQCLVTENKIPLIGKTVWNHLTTFYDDATITFIEQHLKL